MITRKNVIFKEKKFRKNHAKKEQFYIIAFITILMLKKIALGAALVALVGCDLSRRPKHPHTETPAAKKEEPKIPKAPYEVRFTEMGFEIASTSGLYPRFSHYVSSFGKICTLNLEGVAIKDLDCDDRTDNMAIN